MLLATILCSDPGCDQAHEVAVETLDELEGFACDCGHGFVIAAVAELREPGGVVVPLRPAARRADAGRRAA